MLAVKQNDIWEGWKKIHGLGTLDEMGNWPGKEELFCTETNHWHHVSYVLKLTSFQHVMWLSYLSPSP